MQFGTVLERNFTRAFELFTELSEQGNPAGQQVNKVMHGCTSYIVIIIIIIIIYYYYYYYYYYYTVIHTFCVLITKHCISCHPQGLGFMYATGIGMKSNQAKVRELYCVAAMSYVCLSFVFLLHTTGHSTLCICSTGRAPVCSNGNGELHIVIVNAFANNMHNLHVTIT